MQDGSMCGGWAKPSRCSKQGNQVNVLLLSRAIFRSLLKYIMQSTAITNFRQILWFPEEAYFKPTDHGINSQEVSVMKKHTLNFLALILIFREHEICNIQ